ncbi:hypothetical protein HY501_01200 [Candidatus Woesearchaeota archaeon]|nr:hypothetical protein [Candidatus Woesearchaeota archaeon]
MQMSKEEQIGIHKGSLSVLAKEREEFIRMLSIVEQLMQAHMKALKDLGVDLEAEAKKIQEKMQQQPQGKTPAKSGADLSGRLRG